MFSTKVAGDKVPVRLWTPIEEVEEQALQQLKNIASLPWVFHHMAAMPDVHYGIGATVGSVIAMKDAVSPAAVGVDIGCGMGAVKTGLKATDLPESLKEIRHEFERSIPVGHNAHKVPAFERTGFLKAEAEALFSELGTLTKETKNLSERAVHQLGTLGGGNHFIELCLDTEGNVWIMLHSGSRNIGKTLAEIHIEKAKKLAHNQDLPDIDLAVFLAGTPQMQAYRHDLFWAQRYAMLNRKLMMALLIRGLQDFFPKEKLKPETEVWCHHNYVAEEKHFGEEVLVTRKGAIRAGKGELGIIPGSMGTKSYIVRGLGNPESFESASHGAGRRMSRGKARRTFSVKDLEEQTKGVECRKDAGVLDEIPGAYKDIDVVMENQKDLVEVVAQLRQVLCVKG
jgi:tRNA-splicing ligase RtcB